jgi:hypothetical protein
MNPFRTTLNAGVSTHTISLSQPVFTIGSCFADAIGSRLVQSRAQALSNPFGIAYNPESIHKLLGYAVANQSVPAHTYLQHHDLHFNYDFHSGLSSSRKDELQHNLSNTIDLTHRFLKESSWLLITYGTAWVYERVDNGEIVANCHKQPADLFRKKLLSHDQITTSFTSLYERLKAFNPGLRIILTVSPVRHIKDTLPLNSVSKSILRLACHSILEKFPDIDYFPAYEILLDDLRDYRFYKRDMIHPTEEAEDYIWEQFVTRYFDNTFRQFLEKWQTIQRALAHKPFHAASIQHQKFLRETIARLEELSKFVNVDNEIDRLKAQLV